MKILIDYRSVVSTTHGGVTAVINQIVEFLVENKYQVVLLTNNTVSSLAQTTINSKYFPSMSIVATTYQYSMTGIHRFLFDQFQLGKYIDQANVDVVIFPDSFGVPHTQSKTRKILWLHDFIPLHLTDNVSLADIPLYYLSMRSSLKNADLIVAISETVRREAIKRFGVATQKIITIHDGLDLSKIKKLPLESSFFAASQTFGIQQHKFFVVLANARKRKRLMYTIQIYNEIIKNEKFASYKLVIMSKSRHQTKTPSSLHEYDRVMNYIEQHNLQSKVLFTGILDDETKFSLLAYATYCFFLSNDEGFGLPLLESLVVNTPVVVSDLPVSREIGQEFVTYLRLDLSPAEAAKKIVDVMQSDQKLNQGEVSKYIRENFDFKNNLKALIPYLDKSIRIKDMQ